MSGSREEQRQRLRAIAQRVAASHGTQVFDVQLRRESIGWVARIIIDRANPASEQGRDQISLEDCRRVSQDVGPLLDVEGVFDHAYTLEVSSPGLDRPLRNAADYRRFIGRLAKIVVCNAVDGQWSLAGRISDVTDENVVLESGSRSHRIPFGVITRGRLEVEF